MHDPSRTFRETDQEMKALQERIADLRQTGARAAADQKMSGAEVMNWLKRHGAADTAARTLCVEIIKERRAARAAAEAQP